jgi:D-arabinose 1-dehydrogenase-like Zn-dependent alcohol dehydrogenase
VICCGGLGLYAIQYAKAMSFKVIGTDVNDATLSLATEAGADVVFNSMESKDKYVDDIQKATAGGAHAAAVFSAAKLAYDGALAVLRMGSLIMAIGLMAKPIEIDSIAFMRGLFRIKSISTGPPHKMPKAVEFTAKHGIKAKITEYPLEDINKMIESMRNGTSTGRMAVVF